MLHQRINPVWAGEPCIVAATGPSLSDGVVSRVRYTRLAHGWRVIAVNDAYKVMPWADAMYAADNHWWELHKGCSEFSGGKWACHESEGIHADSAGNDKRSMAERYGLNLVLGKDGDEFSFDPGFIRYGSNSGFQAVNLALLLGCRRIVLVGFDMRSGHFFGDHKNGLHNASDATYAGYAQNFAHAAKRLPADVSIVNATPGSAMKCFPIMSLEDACREEIPGANDRLHSDRTEPHAAAG